MGTTAIVKPQSNLGALNALLTQHKDQIAMALPKHLTPERMIRIALTATSRSQTLMKCEPATIAGCVVQASILGLEPDGIMGEAYLVPFRNGRTNRYECQLIPGYQGLLKLARNSGEIMMVNAQVVRANDRFEFEDGLDPYLLHKRAAGERGPVVAYWAGAVLKGGGKQFVVMYRDEVEQHRDKYSKSAKRDDSPWSSNFDEMALKTCLRKLCKLLPRSTQAQAAISLDERHEAGLPQQFTAEVPLALQPPPDDDDPGATVDMPRRASESAEPPAA